MPTDSSCQQKLRSGNRVEHRIGIMSRLKRDECPAIVLGTGESALGAIRSLRRAGIPVAHSKKKTNLAAWSRFDISLDDWPAKALGPAELANWLRSTRLESAVLFPCSDAWVQSVALLDEATTQDFRRWTPGAAAVETMIDKNRFRAMLEELDLPHPRSWDLARDTDTWQVPGEAFNSAFLKPHDSLRFFSKFGVKGLFVSGRKDAFRKARQVWDEDIDLLLQEYIPGPPQNHYFIDGFHSKDGTVTQFLARQRLRMYPADFGNSTSMKTVALDAVRPALDCLTSIFSHTGFHGIFSAEFKRDERDGILRIIEINCRPWWFVDYADRCGLRTCKSAYRDALNLEIAAEAPYRLGELGTYPVYDWEVFTASGDRSASSFMTMITNWVRSYQPIFSWSDPMPVIVNFLRLARGAFQKRARNLFRSRVQEIPDQSR